MNKVLDNIEWEEFNVAQLFDIKKCNGYSKKKLINGNIPYVARSANNNGVTNYCNNKEFLYEENTITIHHEWKDFYIAFFQNEKYTTDGMIYRLKNENITNKYVGMFVSTILSNTQANLKADRQCGLKTIQIFLPTDKKGNPNWKAMEEYMKQIEREIVIKV